MKENIKKDQWDSGLFAIEFLEYDYEEKYFLQILTKICTILNCEWNAKDVLKELNHFSIEIMLNDSKDNLLLMMDNWSFSAGFSSEEHRDKVFNSLEE
ncbi:MAG TPA: hypothetical protein PKC21_03395 [Oligoflexia bacterium]|nr:hypothetical protein [Oligoflexia bacterium]HMR24380.1 hypothetical protein [Oligoflexia bacterium]